MADDFIPAPPGTCEQLFYEPIGRYVFQFGYLERDIDWALSALTGMEYQTQGSMIFSQIKSLPSKIKLLAALTPKITKTESLRNQMAEICSELDEQRNFRNALVHGPWNGYSFNSVNPQDGAWQKLYISTRLNFSTFEVSIKDLEDNQTKVIALSAKLVNLIQEILCERSSTVAPPPSHDKPLLPLFGSS